ncbi:tRNA (adenosine(37)-N6)-threonylcarbamoyltransferase complex dimerization subunit type 1 TsaB [Ottowia testudinis]|uniref:tRNA (Adenosine(37)-N6)-threonylcarbamoyltransferase complex dimerization subunit type 1 TsaB n=1 Tax=Ottowia testudinis TaxID=2816950 RepID=A0A975H593_9BURK|nr:tRNA (adenosine(37)-N6)-threonylcarbamoyltransferase complex dimerization subunit type 1 TsaB [Ottowia testudinis]QTD47205.1 tRNA (adenosine(37)-N6)-threonylcarbamoyltransferase complex dimerization subunit type 1 TsaB [Ottowia testudinis]
MNLLAFDTSTEHLSAAVLRGADGERFVREGAGGPQASATLIPTVQALLAQAGLSFSDLHAIAFGRGPGSFTGLRTACSVAQGLAYGAGVPVLPIDTLLAVAESARARHGATRVLALLDARMNEVYAAEYAWADATGWRALGEPAVGPPEALPAPADGALLAGNVFTVYGERLPPALRALPRAEVLPGAHALLALAPALLAAGRAVPAEQALPLYIRDKVALTTAERSAASPAR